MLLKLSELLYSLSFKLRQKALYFELKYYIVTQRSYLKAVYSWDRALGKSCTLIKLAQKYKCPIAVPSNKAKNYLQGLSKVPVEIVVIKDSSKGKRFDLILCEEGFDEKIINNILKPIAKVLVGYEFIY